MAARPRLGVLGWPVAHSRSPALQNAALQAVGLTDWRYQLLPVPPELFRETVKALPDAGFRGANVTIPHKGAALELADEATVRAREIGAANTLTFDESGAIGADNTDAPALIEALPFPVNGRSALVLGAGGSARAAVWALLDAGASEVSVWNRTAARAKRLGEELGATPVSSAPAADFLIHCTSSGLRPAHSQFDDLPLHADQLTNYQCVVDLVYADTETPLIKAAQARGVAVVDGLELLVAQGAISFELLTGRVAPVGAMRAAVGIR